MTNRMHLAPIVLKTVIVVIAFCVSLPMAFGAELYRYTDKTGAVRYTDNLAKVPTDQRQRMEKIVTPTPSKGGSESIDSTTADEAAVKDAMKESEVSPEDDLRQLEFERLNQEKKMLDEEFADLKKTKEELDKNKDQLDAKSYNEQANQLNQRIETYEEKREAFKKAADAFNAQINKNG